MMERIFDALIVLLAAFSESIFENIADAFGLNLSKPWVLVGAAATALLIFLGGLIIERLVGSWRFFRLHILRDRRAEVMGTWIDVYQKTMSSPSRFYAICHIKFDAVSHEYGLEGASYLPDGTLHSGFRSVSLVFPDERLNQEIRYHYRAELLGDQVTGTKPRALYGSASMFFGSTDRGKGWFWDEDDVSQQTLMESARLNKELYSAIGLHTKRWFYLVPSKAEEIRTLITQLDQKRTSVYVGLTI